MRIHKKGQTIHIDLRKGIDRVAKELGVTRQTIYNWKTGKSFPNKSHLEKLLRVKKAC